MGSATPKQICKKEKTKNKLFDLAADLDNSASNEGCEASLMVVEAQPLWDLMQYVKLLKASSQALPQEAATIRDRLQDSEEHATESAIPEVAEDAAELIAKLATALAVAEQRADTAEKFVGRVAGLSVWDCDMDDGTPYAECEEPADGYEDSHNALMGLIEDARKIEHGMGGH